MFFPTARVILGVPLFFFLYVFELPAVIVLGFWFLSQYLNGLFVLAAGALQAGGVAWWAHIGGFIAGMILGPLMRQRRPRYYFSYDYDRMRF